jgi:hypothetical protein
LPDLIRQSMLKRGRQSVAVGQWQAHARNGPPGLRPPKGYHRRINFANRASADGRVKPAGDE